MNKFVASTNYSIQDGIDHQILHLEGSVTNEPKEIYAFNNELINFGSYLYLGLETHPKLKEAIKLFTDKYGTQFGMSRAYLSLDPYIELEEKLSRIFETPTIVAQSTAQAHQSVIPTLVDKETALLIDYQAHASLHVAAKIVNSFGTFTRVLQHNDVNELEDWIRELRKKYKAIWYLCDSVYSMFGDFAPLRQLRNLTEIYPEFHLYIDDAHGMSWRGKHGRGYALDKIELNDQIIVTTSLNKAFCGNGGAIIIQNDTYRKAVENCGGPLIFSCPIPPPMLGANIASADIHLSDEIKLHQKNLQEKISLCNRLFARKNIPVVQNNTSPIFYVGLGIPKVGYNMVHRLKNEGFFTTIALFPAVPPKQVGMRVCINNHHSFDDLVNLTDAIEYHLPKAMNEEKFTPKELNASFNMKLMSDNQVTYKDRQMYLERFDTITDIEEDFWNDLFEANGSFDWQSLKILEETFQNNKKPENNWKFYYFIVRDMNSDPVFVTFFSVTIGKDDLFSPASVSKKVESKRKQESYFLCSRTLTMGSYITEGKHYYYDKDKDWKGAMRILLNELSMIQEQEEIKTIIFRDIYENDPEFASFIHSEGFFKYDLPLIHVINDPQWGSDWEFLKSLSINAKKNARKDILKFEEEFDIKFHKEIPPDKLDIWYELYLNVKRKSFELNSFELPKIFFENVLKDPCWEVIELNLFNKPVGVIFCHLNSKCFSPMLLGMDYSYINSHKLYKQCLYQAVKRPVGLGYKTIYMGFTASTAKKGVGAIPVKTMAFVQTTDNYNLNLLANLEMKSKESDYAAII